MTKIAPHSSSPLTIVSTNPAKGYAVLGEVKCSTQSDVTAAVSKARAAQTAWWQIGLEARIVALRTLNILFKQHRDEFVKRTSEEMGMNYKLSCGMVDGAPESLEWNCANAANYLSDEITHEDEQEVNLIRYEPYGVIACIAPWNFPIRNFVVALSQALLAGNTVVMKYSEEIVLFGQYMEKIIAKSAIPEGVINFVHGDGQVGAWLADSDIDFLSFTGSTATGRKLYQKAAEKFIPIALELGGSSPGIVFEDCELDNQLIETLFNKRFSNSGQFCSNLKRLIVHESLFDDCIEKLTAYAKTVSLGDPLDPNINLGPLVAERQVIKLEDQVKDALDKGATLHCGGKRPDGLEGAFYEPTILSNVTPDMKVWCEEVFGPALPIVKFSTYEEAMALANDTEHGLTGYIYTKDTSTMQRAANDLKAGCISTKNATFYRPQNPFGGYKASGLGRHSGKHGFHEACQIKTFAYQKI